MVSKSDAAPGGFGYSIERDWSAGWLEEGILQLNDPPRPETRQFDPEAPYAKRFRAETIINTLTVLGPGQATSLPTEPRGARL